MKSPAHFCFVALLLFGCAHSQPEHPRPFFPQLASPPPGLEEVWLTAAFEGTLVVADGCVKVRSLDGQLDTTVLWYQGIELVRDKSGLSIQNIHTGETARFNVPAKFGGGDASDEHVQRNYPEVARRCGPPYAVGYPSDAP